MSHTDCPYYGRFGILYITCFNLNKPAYDVFGLLSSIATSQQIRRSVFFEAFVLAAIGIPIGVLSGIAGIVVTLHLLRDLFTSIMPSGIHISMTLSVSTLSVIAAVALATVTIIISAYIPAWRSSKISPIDAIRQTIDIKLTTRQVRTWKLVRKLFGMEGDLALKNLKRSRKRYRSTVISLFMSIVLFVSASSFSMYLMDGVADAYRGVEHDLSYYIPKEIDSEDTVMKVYRDIVLLDSIEQGSIVRPLYSYTNAPKKYIDRSYYDEMIGKGYISDGEDVSISVYIYGVDRDTFKYYLNKLGLEEPLFTNPDFLWCTDKQHYYDSQQKKFINSNIFGSNKPESISIHWEDGENGWKRRWLISYADEALWGSELYRSF